MSYKNWQQWGKRPNEIESTLVDRASSRLPEMESTKQLVNLVSQEYKPGMQVLDVGCNVGHYLRGLRRISSDLDYTGVDAYEQYINKANEIFADDPYSHFEVKDIFKPLFSDKSFDIVFCCNVLLHLPDFRAPVQNLLYVTKKICFIRTLLSEKTTIVKTAKTQKFNELGDPLDYTYQNTWKKQYFLEHIKELGWNVEFIDDEFDPKTLQNEFHSVKKGQGTQIIDGKQVDGNVIFNWVWAKITPV